MSEARGMRGGHDKCLYGLVKKFERRRAFERKILKLTLMGGCEEDSSDSEWGTVAGSRENENTLSVNIKCMKFLDCSQNISISKTILRH